MRRDQLEHAIRTACQIAGLTEVIIVGSQAILGTYTEDQLPFYATRSVEGWPVRRPRRGGSLARQRSRASDGGGGADVEMQGRLTRHAWLL
jgi:hypothetical protein